MTREQPDTPTARYGKSTLTPFSVPIFRNIWSASMAANFGMLIQSVGASWMMISLGASAPMVALVQSSISLPIMLLALVAGALADNRDRRKLMLIAQYFMMTVSVTLTVTAALGLLTPWLLLTFTFLIGCGTAIYAPAWQASVGDMVPRELVPGAVALNSMGFNLARSIGPAIGGAIVAAVGAAAAFGINAISYVAMLFVLTRWRPERPPRLLPPERVVDAMLAGIRYISMSPTLWTVLLRAGLFGLAASAMPAMMPLVARDLVRGDALTYGVLLGAFGVGAVGGALGSTRLRARWSTEKLVRIGTLALAAGSAVAGLSRFMPLTIIGLIFGGAGWVLVLSSFNVTVQMASPRWVVARALSLYQMAAFGGMAAGAWIAGIIAESHGVGITLLCAAAAALIGIVPGMKLPLPAFEALNLDPLTRWREPQTAFPILPRSGPILISIAYRIDEADIAQFLAAMHNWRRIRIRDGARSWKLTRDLEDPLSWTESYELPTWVHYVRHNQRRTQADVSSWQALRRLHRAEAPPVIRRGIERQTGGSSWQIMGARALVDTPIDPTGGT